MSIYNYHDKERANTMDEIKDTEIMETTETTELTTGAPDVPYIVYESAQVRAERNTSKLIGVIVLLVVLLAGTNAFWLYEWMSYDYESTTETYTQDGGGFNNLNTGTQGDVTDEPETDNKESVENQTEK